MLLVVTYHEVEKADRAVFHLIYKPFDKREDIVVEELEDDGDDKTEESGKQGDLDTSGNDGCRDVTNLLDLIEGFNHTDDGTQESERRSDGDKEADPAEVLLEQAHLHAAIRSNGFLNDINALVITAEALIEDTCNRSACIAANFHSFFYTTCFEGIFNIFEESLGVGFGKAEVDDTLNAESETKDKAEESGRHEAGTTFDKLGFERLMQSYDTAVSFFSRSFSDCRSSSLIRDLFCCSRSFRCILSHYSHAAAYEHRQHGKGC